MAQPHPHHHQAFGYSSSSSVHQSFDTCDSGELLGLQAGMEMLSLPTNSLFPTQISSSSQGLLSLSLSHPHPENLYHHHHQQHHHQDEGGFYQSYQLRNSVYLRPAQELLNEFCGLDVGGSSSSKQKQKARKDDQQDHDATSSSSTWNQSLPTMDLLELQKRKALLLSMLEEVDRKYKKYCEQMQGVVSSFEEVVGEGSATVYSRLASRAMSKHFRCLRDGIVDQLKTTKYYKVKVVMGEKDASTVGSGTTKRVTPRLRMLDQCLRQQKAHSAGLLESQPWRPQRGLPERSVTILRAWLFEHFLHPYPSDVDKHILARQTGLSKSQVSNWFINARVRLWKPMVEEMYMQETKDQDDDDNNHQSDNDIDNNSPPSNQNPNLNPSSSYDHQDQKPQRAAPAHHHLQIDDPDLNFGVVDLDFSPYNNNNNNNNNNQGFGNGVSLTLGLQQSLFFTREQMEVLDGDLQAQNLPYRDSIGSHLLHDLA